MASSIASSTLLAINSEEAARIRLKVKRWHQAHPEQEVLCCLSPDNAQRLTSAFKTALAIFSMGVGCLLAVVVPRSCVGGNGCATSISHPCSVFDMFNSENLDALSLVTLIFNFATLAAVFIQYMIVYHREVTLIRFLDVSQTHVAHGLRKQLLAVPEYAPIQRRLARVHKNVAIATGISLTMFVINTILSALLIKATYLDFRSITVLLTNLAVFGGNLVTCLMNAFVGLRRDMACSNVETVAVNYNIIDRDYLHGMDDHTEKPLAPTSSSMDRPAVDCTTETLFTTTSLDNTPMLTTEASPPHVGVAISHHRVAPNQVAPADTLMEFAL